MSLGILSPIEHFLLKNFLFVGTVASINEAAIISIMIPMVESAKYHLIYFIL